MKEAPRGTVVVETDVEDPKSRNSLIPMLVGGMVLGTIGLLLSMVLT